MSVKERKHREKGGEKVARKKEMKWIGRRKE